MRRSSALLVTVFFIFFGNAQNQTSYIPSPSNLETRKIFQDMKFGMFIHWGASSVLGAGEWVMHNRNIKVNDYKQLLNFFNPNDFNAKEWVATAKDAGMKYITFITRHHDGFSNWDTKASEWKITNTDYGKDVLKLLSDECEKQGMKLALYYSLLDWYRDDYPYETGRTGKGTGRTAKSNYASYLAFMKAQLTELLTNYGKISAIWFDGHWDQTEPEGASDRSSRIDWKYGEIYSLIHKLQPQCMVGNNHHLSPLEGEDFQMFERDLPGENHSGLSFQKPSQDLPLETCETLNDSWGYNITDRRYKNVKQVIHLLVNAAGRNANLLLNIGPMPDGKIQTEFNDTLKAVGNWLQSYGESIYGTRGNLIPPQPWGVVTTKEKFIYMHILNPTTQGYVFISGNLKKIKKASIVGNSKTILFKQQAEGLFVYIDQQSLNEIDTIIKLETE
ncbi:MAG: alpha-L-fucosidase [Flavisolibacter sp.]